MTKGDPDPRCSALRSAVQAVARLGWMVTSGDPMAPVSADQIELIPTRGAELSRLAARARTMTQRLALRISIVLLAARGRPNTARLSICVDTAARWRAAPGLPSLVDGKRSGRPPTFTPVQVKALACRPAVDSGAPLSRWPAPESARQVIPMGSARKSFGSDGAAVAVAGGAQAGAVPVVDSRHRPAFCQPSATGARP